MIWRAKRLWDAATGPTGRDVADREPLTAGYCIELTKLLVSGKIGLWTWVWAMRARPASLCGCGGSYALSEWIL